MAQPRVVGAEGATHNMQAASDEWTMDTQVSAHSNFPETINAPEYHSLFHLPSAVSASPITITLEADVAPIKDGGGYWCWVFDCWARDLRGLFSHCALEAPGVILSTWSKEQLTVMGNFFVNVHFRSHSAKLSLLVMTGNGPSLLGWNWFPHLGITIEGIHTLRPTQIPQQLEAFRDIFTPSLGNYAGLPAQVVLKSAAKPVFRRSRPVPFALTQRVSEQIDKMAKENILMPVKYSEWATPTVNVVKGDGSIRICGDYSATVNPACMRQIFPLPTIDEMLSKLSAGSFFAKIDLSEAFLQVGVDEESFKILKLNTHKGLIRMLRLPPGLCSAPAIFQGIMETILAGLEGVLVYIDDILCHAPSKDLLWARVKSVLGRVRDVGFKLKLEKCKFDVKALDFLGYSLSEKGIQPTREKLISLLNAPSLTNVAELQGYLGYVNYYDRFFPHKATAFAPLSELLCDKEPWRCTAREEECVRYIKKVMSSGTVLKCYDPKLPLVQQCDLHPMELVQSYLRVGMITLSIPLLLPLGY
ncbi:uncharacterized protein K02A2.6-like [Ischnura elegans]|uniref:uncharacterized protein K02A2.6-like n=1 Tax=Ischnura elegans TaxID=197161 RepID=UPI001ED8A221|nr:uncharacterized protein K02A2.6-like [Ischnura elegans]